MKAKVWTAPEIDRLANEPDIAGADALARELGIWSLWAAKKEDGDTRTTISDNLA